MFALFEWPDYRQKVDEISKPLNLVSISDTYVTFAINIRNVTELYIPLYIVQTL